MGPSLCRSTGGRDTSAAKAISVNNAKSAARNRSINLGRVSGFTTLMMSVIRNDPIAPRINQRLGCSPVAYQSQKNAVVNNTASPAKTLKSVELVMEGTCSLTGCLFVAGASGGQVLRPFSAALRSKRGCV